MFCVLFCVHLRVSVIENIMAEEEFELSDCRKKYVDANLFQYNSHGPKTSIGWKNCKVSMKCCKCSFLSSAANNSASNMIKHYQTKHPLIKLNISSKKGASRKTWLGPVVVVSNQFMILH